MPSCAACDVRWTGDEACWSCGQPVVAGVPLEDVEEETDLYMAWGVWG